MINAIHDYIEHLGKTGNRSKNTQVSYERDLKTALQYFDLQGIKAFSDVKPKHLESYLNYLNESSLSPATISRRISALRSFFRYLKEENKIKTDPSDRIRAPKVETKMPVILTMEEVYSLLAAPDTKSAKGIRDKAMLELLYATGIRVSELIGLKVSDVNVNKGYLIRRDRGVRRIIPFSSSVKKALNKYLSRARDLLLSGEKSDLLFVNCSGTSMSRQGFWKVLKSYAQAAGIDSDITPHTLRHSLGAHLLMRGMDAKNVQAILGHSDISTTYMYSNMIEKGMCRL